jgi:hypothetical protein
MTAKPLRSRAIALAALAALAGCAHATVRPPPPPPPPSPLSSSPPAADSLPDDCSPNGVMGAPENPEPIVALDPATPGETIELLTCKIPPPPYTPKLDDQGKPDENDAYWHSFATWKAYLVRRGAHPFVGETDLAVGQYHEGSADARLVGVVPGRVPLVLIMRETSGMVSGQDLVLYRIDGRPQRVATPLGELAQITDTGFVLGDCEGEQRSNCTTTTYTWTGTALAVTPTIP